MDFEWDEAKNLSNFRKHGTWFEEAQTIWADESSSEFFDPEHSDVEARFIRIGYSAVHHLLLVVFCERSGGEVVRLIFAWPGTKSERRQYEEGI